jgi:hypothetical protein
MVPSMEEPPAIICNKNTTADTHTTHTHMTQRGSEVPFDERFLTVTAAAAAAAALEDYDHDHPYDEKKMESDGDELMMHAHTHPEGFMVKPFHAFILGDDFLSIYIETGSNTFQHMRTCITHNGSRRGGTIIECIFANDFSFLVEQKLL